MKKLLIAAVLLALSIIGCAKGGCPEPTLPPVMYEMRYGTIDWDSVEIIYWEDVLTEE